MAIKFRRREGGGVEVKKEWIPLMISVVALEISVIALIVNILRVLQ